MQIVVLFGADPRVIRYSKEVQTTFLENGIDVYLQTEDSGQRITQIISSVLSISSLFCDLCATVFDILWWADWVLYMWDVSH